MNSVNVEFCRMYLKQVHHEVKRRFPELNLWASASVYRYSAAVYVGNNKQYQFHVMSAGFVVDISADNAYDARAKGWELFLKKQQEVEAA